MATLSLHLRVSVSPCLRVKNPLPGTASLGSSASRTSAVAWVQPSETQGNGWQIDVVARFTRRSRVALPLHPGYGRSSANSCTVSARGNEVRLPFLRYPAASPNPRPLSQREIAGRGSGTMTKGKGSCGCRTRRQRRKPGLSPGFHSGVHPRIHAGLALERPPRPPITAELLSFSNQGISTLTRSPPKVGERVKFSLP